MFFYVDSNKMVNSMQWKSYPNLSLLKIKKRKSLWTKEILWFNLEIKLTLLNYFTHSKPNNILFLLWNIMKEDNFLIWLKDSEKWIKEQLDFISLKYFWVYSKSMIIILFIEILSLKILWSIWMDMPILLTLGLLNLIFRL